MQIFIDNTGVLELVDLRLTTTGLFENTGTVTATLYAEADDLPVVGQTWPLAMPNVGDGHYRGLLASTLELTEGALYYALIDYLGPGGAVGRFKLRLRARERDAC